MGEKQALTEFENKRLLRKISRLEQEIFELRSKIVAQEKVRSRKSSAKKRKKLKNFTDQSPQRSASKKTNCESGAGLEYEKNSKSRILRCFSKSSGKGLLESIKAKGNDLETEKIKLRPTAIKNYRSGSKEFSYLEPCKEKKKQSVCKTCLRLMSKGYSTRFCPTHGSYAKSNDKNNHLQ